MEHDPSQCWQTLVEKLTETMLAEPTLSEAGPDTDATPGRAAPTEVAPTTSDANGGDANRGDAIRAWIVEPDLRSYCWATLSTCGR